MAVNRKNVMKYIKSDVFRYYGKCSAGHLIKCYFTDALVRFHFALRLASVNGIRGKIGKVLWKMNRTKKRIAIPYSTRIGYGLYIAHSGPVVVNPTAQIGNNVTLSQFTTIGSNHEKAATIGDCTYIGPNCCIVEDVVIGKNVTIGAGSVVTKDIPDNATACGNYAKVINYNDPGRYTQENRWTDCEE